MRHLLLAGLLAAVNLVPAQAATKPAAAAAAPTPVALNLAVRDLTPRFLDFYESAIKPPPPPPAPPAPAVPANGKAPAAAPVPVPPPVPVEAESDRRWRLYKQYYNFTTQSDEAQARSALELAWPKYMGAIKQIEAGFNGLTPPPEAVINSLAGQFILESPLSLRFVAYVGTFDGKVWSQAEDGVTNVYLPLEVDADARGLPMTRLLGRLMLDRSAAWAGKPRNLAEFIVGEALLARAMQEAVPGKKPEQYLDISPEAYTRVMAGRAQIYKGIGDKLKSANIADYQSGDKLAEARVAGWALTEILLKKVRIADLIRQKPNDLAEGSVIPLIRAASAN